MVGKILDRTNMSTPPIKSSILRTDRCASQAVIKRSIHGMNMMNKRKLLASEQTCKLFAHAALTGNKFDIATSPVERNSQEFRSSSNVRKRNNLFHEFMRESNKSVKRYSTPFPTFHSRENGRYSSSMVRPPT